MPPSKLQKLKPEAIRAWHHVLLDTGLSARTVGHAHRLLRIVLGYAVKSGTLTRNVAAVERPPAVEIHPPSRSQPSLSRWTVTACIPSCRSPLPLA